MRRGLSGDSNLAPYFKPWLWVRPRGAQERTEACPWYLQPQGLKRGEPEPGGRPQRIGESQGGRAGREITEEESEGEWAALEQMLTKTQVRCT